MSGLFQRFSTPGKSCSSPNVSHSPEIHAKILKYQNNRFPSKQPVGSHKDGFLGNAHSSWVANWASHGKNNFRLPRKKEDLWRCKKNVQDFSMKDIFWVAGLGASTFPDPFVTCVVVSRRHQICVFLWLLLPWGPLHKAVTI